MALEIGTGSGYFAALLASQAAEVDSVEIDPRLAVEARAKLARHAFQTVRVTEGDGARGYGNDVYDVIVLTGSTPLIPERFFEQLKSEGRLFAVVGEAPVMEARLIRQTAPGARVSVDLFETVIERIVNAATPARFQF